MFICMVRCQALDTCVHCMVRRPSVTQRRLPRTFSFGLPGNAPDGVFDDEDRHELGIQIPKTSLPSWKLRAFVLRGLSEQMKLLMSL